MTQGVVYRSTSLSTKTVEMLNELQAGQYSKGQRGIYEVQDLVHNRRTDSGTARKVMSTSLEFANNAMFNSLNYRFIINSKSGRYIDGVVSGFEREVLFYQGMVGKFKLLGRQDVNGGEEAKQKAEVEDKYSLYVVY
ncbi:hypothetical protein LZ30DRAFT_741304 [Colletotrichum cereale]|nr:hypothetical protein LZ30DRAFT_741304 [Colletotrichum cereale]